MKSRAAVFYGAGMPLEVREIDLDEPRANDVLVRMSAVGICGTDLHSIKGEWVRPTPVVLGHEGAGVVEAVGADVTSLKPGDEVVLSWAPACGAVRRLPPRPARRLRATCTARSAPARSSTAPPG